MNTHDTKAVLLGIPMDLGAKNLGVADGPDAFRAHSIIKKLKGASLSLTDLGNEAITDRDQLDPGDHRARYLDEIARVSEAVAKKTDQAIQGGNKVIAIGGDHSINLGVVSGASVALGGDLGLIYLDAHGDMNTPETTLTGNLHGMHLASLLGWGPDKFTSLYGPAPKIAQNNLLHIGGCDFDQAELDLRRREDLNTFMMFDLLSNGLAPLLTMIDALSTRVSNIWVSLDLDCIDEIYAPGAGMPNKRGLSYREVATIAEYIGQKCNVIGIDVVEYNPAQDVNNKTAELGIELIAKFLGHDYSWYATDYLAANNVNAAA